MEVKPGYKATEVGVIPDTWGVASFDAVFRKVQAKNHQIQTKDYQESGAYPVVDQGQEPIIGYSDREDKVYRVPDGGVVIFGDHTCIVKLVTDDFIVGADGTQILAARELQDAEFHAYALMHRGVAATGYNRHFKFLKERRFQVPPPSEQRAIAAALSDVDALLDGLDRLIAKKRDLKQAAMQQLLTGQTRLPGFSGEWEVLRAGDIGAFKGGNGFPLTAQGDTSGEYPFFKVSDMNNEGNETFMTTANHYISEETRRRLGATAFPAESIVFAKVGAAVFLERKKILRQPSCIDNNMAAFVLDKARANVRYVHFLLLSKKLGDLVATTALPALSAKQLGEMPLAIPPLPEQTAIAAVLSDMDAELAALEARRDKTWDLKQAMMQELLTGKTRLVKPEAAHA